MMLTSQAAPRPVRRNFRPSREGCVAMSRTQSWKCWSKRFLAFECGSWTTTSVNQRVMRSSSSPSRNRLQDTPVLALRDNRGSTRNVAPQRTALSAMSSREQASRLICRSRKQTRGGPGTLKADSGMKRRNEYGRPEFWHPRGRPGNRTTVRCGSQIRGCWSKIKPPAQRN